MWIHRWRWKLLYTRINAFNLRSFSLDQYYNFETPSGDIINYAVVVYGVITSWQNSQARRSTRLSYKPFVCSRHSTNWIQYNIKRGEKSVPVRTHTRWSSLSWFGHVLDDVEKPPLACEAHARHPGLSTAGTEEKKNPRDLHL